MTSDAFAALERIVVVPKTQSINAFSSAAVSVTEFVLALAAGVRWPPPAKWTPLKQLRSPVIRTAVWSSSVEYPWKNETLEIKHPVPEKVMSGVTPTPEVEECEIRARWNCLEGAVIPIRWVAFLDQVKPPDSVMRAVPVVPPSPIRYTTSFFPVVQRLYAAVKVSFAVDHVSPSFESDPLAGSTK